MHAGVIGFVPIPPLGGPGRLKRPRERRRTPAVAIRAPRVGVGASGAGIEPSPVRRAPRLRYGTDGGCRGVRSVGSGLLSARRRDSLQRRIDSGAPTPAVRKPRRVSLDASAHRSGSTPTNSCVGIAERRGSVRRPVPQHASHSMRAPSSATSPRPRQAGQGAPSGLELRAPSGNEIVPFMLHPPLSRVALYAAVGIARGRRAGRLRRQGHRRGGGIALAFPRPPVFEPLTR